jgi:voltage-gated potassium channel Kch
MTIAANEVDRAGRQSVIGRWLASVRARRVDVASHSVIPTYQWYLVAAAGLAAFALGCWGYADAGKGVTDVIYNSLKLFLGSPPQRPFGWQLDVARFLAPLVAGFAGFSALRVVFWDRVQQMRIPLMRNHVVVCGLGYVGSVFVRRLRAEGKKVVVIDSDADNKHFELCRALGVPVIIGDAQQERTLRAARVDHAARLLAVCDHDAINAEIISLTEQLAARRTNRELHCLARINDSDLCRQFRIRAITRQGTGPSVDFLNVEDAAARRLLDDFPIADGIDRPHILVAHLDRLGQSLIVQAALDWQVSRADKSAPLHVSILDDNAEARIKSLRAEHPFATAVCTFHHGTLTAGGIRDLLRRQENEASVPPITSAFITAYRDEDGLETALKLQHPLLGRGETKPVVAALSRAHGMSRLVNEDRGQPQQDALRFKVFQTLKHVCTTDVIEAGMVETVLARRIYEFRRDMARAEGRDAPTWDQLSAAEQESNRAQARDIPVKLRKLGYKIAPADGSREVEHRLSDQHIETLMRDEQVRLWKDRIAARWTYGETGDEEHKRQPNMKPFDELAPDDAEKVRALLRALPQLLASLRLRIVERPV